MNLGRDMETKLDWSQWFRFESYPSSKMLSKKYKPVRMILDKTTAIPYVNIKVSNKSKLWNENTKNR